ncbi:hypothetical protein AAHH78_35085, partial [Burkholderia pseudomallei]
FACAHLSNHESADGVTRTLLDFRTAGRERLEMTDDERYEGGMNVRRAVVGDAQVVRSVSSRTEVSAVLQKLLSGDAGGVRWWGVGW